MIRLFIWLIFLVSACHSFVHASSLKKGPPSPSKTSLKVAGIDLGLGKLFDKSFSLVWDEVRQGQQEASQEVADLRDWITKKVGATPEEVIHPVFGEILKDLVYKRIYSTSVAKLVDIPLWQSQRIYRKERAQLLARDIQTKLEKGQCLTLPGVITVYEWGDKYGLLDGQHRVGALRMLSEEGILSTDTHLILVEVFPVNSEEAIKRLFTEINTADPVKLIDMPDMAGTAEKDIINSAAELLRIQHPTMFKVSANCRLPHVNIDTLRDSMFKSNIVGRLGMENPDQLVEWIKLQNDKVAKRSNSVWLDSYRGRNEDVITKAIEKARSTHFFLGMDPNWMDFENVEC